MVLINIKGMKGNSDVDGYADWITVDGGFQLGVGRSVTSVGGGKDRDTSDPATSNIPITRPSDFSSPDFFMKAMNGGDEGEIKIRVVDGGGDSKVKVLMEVILGGAKIDSYNFGSGGDRPNENIGISFATISYQYNGFDGAKVKTGTAKKYSFIENKSV